MTPPLRVLVAGLDWPPETFLARLVGGLLDAGERVTVASARRPGPEWTSRPGFEWIRQPGWEGSTPRRLARAAAIAPGAMLRARGLPRFGVRGSFSSRARAWTRLAPLAGRRFDVAYFPWNAGAIAHLPVFDRFPGIVVSCRGAQVQVAPHNPRRAAIADGLRETFRRATYVHCVSAEIAREARGFGLEPAKEVVIRPAVDAEAFRPPEVPRPDDGVIRVASVGALIWRKGYEHALLAIRRWIDRTGEKVEYVVMGSGPERERLLFAAWELGLEDVLVLTGRVPPAEVRRRLQSSDVFLLTSHSEGIANAALEAMASGLPVVTTDGGGMREAVTDGVEGRVVAVRDVAATAGALEALGADAGARAAMGAAGRARVLREFSLPAQVAAFRELLGRAAGRRR